MSKVLICTNHMMHICGSEVVALEVGECFQQKGYHVDIVANYIGAPIAGIVNNSNINLLTTDQLPNPFDYDIVWSQHQVLPILINEYLDDLNNHTYFVFAHLSPYEHLETFGLYCERLFANKIFANSQETLNQLKNLGLPKNKSDIFFNAAPQKFFNDKKVDKDKLENILLVSNHAPDEILEALSILKNEYQINIKHIGVRGNIERLEPELINEVDAIISIGKTVQYAVVSGKPVYCYDHFGGIGWLLLDNYEKAEIFNYSGRCCNRRINADEIVKEMINNFSRAVNEIAQIRKNRLTKYTLDNYIDNIIFSAKESEMLRTFKLSDKQKIRSESEIAKSIKQFYNNYHDLIQSYNHEVTNRENITHKSAILQKDNDELLLRIEQLTHDNEELQKLNSELSNNYNSILQSRNEVEKTKIKLLENYSTLTHSKNELTNRYNQLVEEYNKLNVKYLKYKNSLIKRVARKIKSLYSK